ncbi:MAG: hypothetical protein HN764_05930 [Gammaproteobacteria bacterium]|jgi:cbb3-type cytochrome oxidase subunit 1|nr:hypothetical protein [Gammaproteobacteria bacterium]
MKKLGHNFLMTAILYGLWGTLMGSWLVFTKQSYLSQVHAHINLLGWVTMALFGVFYHFYPKVSESMLAAIHFWVANISVLTLNIGLWMFFEQNGGGQLIRIGAVLVPLSFILFFIVMWQARDAGEAN